MKIVPFITQKSISYLCLTKPIKGKFDKKKMKKYGIKGDMMK